MGVFAGSFCCLLSQAHQDWASHAGRKRLVWGAKSAHPGRVSHLVEVVFQKTLGLSPFLGKRLVGFLPVPPGFLDL